MIAFSHQLSVAHFEPRQAFLGFYENRHIYIYLGHKMHIGSTKGHAIGWFKRRSTFILKKRKEGEMKIEQRLRDDRQ